MDDILLKFLSPLNIFPSSLLYVCGSFVKGTKLFGPQILHNWGFLIASPGCCVVCYEILFIFGKFEYRVLTKFGLFSPTSLSHPNSFSL